jgi:hypothetical protein
MNEARRRFGRESSTQSVAPAALVPAAGVYRYRGRGTERLSLPPKSQSQGPTMPATVVHGASGCWTFRIDYSNNHWQTWEYCAVDGGLIERGGRSFARWDFVVTTYENVTVSTCDPPSVDIKTAMRPGDSWSQRCTAKSSGASGVGVSAGTYTYVGPTTVDVGGTRVPAYHFRQHRTMSGNQDGTQDADLWFARDTGLPLRNDRTVDVRTKTVVGTSTYTERGSFVLTSLRPER